ncbi:formate dehydrogenase subunit gamma, partial [Shewanella sp. 0m-11]
MNKWLKHIGVAIALFFSVSVFANASDKLGDTVDINNGQVWAQLKAGEEGRTTSTSEFHGQAINTYDLRVLELRSDILAPALMAALFG